MNRFPIAAFAAALWIAAAPALAQDVVRESRVFDIEFLTRTSENFPGPRIEITRAFDEAMPPMVENAPEPHLQPAILIGMVKTNVDPDSWGNVKNKLRAEEGKLHVVQTPENLKRIEALLRDLRTRFGDFVEVEGFVLRVKGKFLAEILADLETGKGAWLSEEGARKVLGAGSQGGAVRVAESVSVLAFSGQRVHAAPLRQRTIVRDLDCEVAQQKSVNDPVVSSVSEGFVMDVRPTVGGKAGILLDLDLAWQGLEDPMPFVETPGGRIDLPAAQRLAVRTTLVVPDGGAAFLCGKHPSEGDEGIAFLVRARRKGLAALPGDDKKEEKKEEKAKRTLRVYNVRLLSKRIEDCKPGSDRLCRRTGGGSSAGGAAFAEAEMAGVGLDGEELLTLVRANIAEDTWANERNSIEFSGGCLVVVQEEEVHARIEAFLQELAARRVVLVLATFRWLAVDDAVLAALFPDGPKGAFTSLDAKARTALLDAAREGTKASALGAANLVAFNRQRAFLARRNVAAYVADYDVEVAQAAGAMDPIMDACSDGVLLDARAAVAGDGRNVTLDLAPGIARLERPIREGRYKMEGLEWPMALPEFAIEEFRTSLTVADGGTVLFLGGRVLTGKDRRLVLLVTVKLARPGE